MTRVQHPFSLKKNGSRPTEPCGRRSADWHRQGAGETRGSNSRGDRRAPQRQRGARRGLQIHAGQAAWQGSSNSAATALLVPCSNPFSSQTLFRVGLPSASWAPRCKARPSTRSRLSPRAHWSSLGQSKRCVVVQCASSGRSGCLPPVGRHCHSQRYDGWATKLFL